MVHKNHFGVYSAPVLKDLSVCVEKGFSISGNFEQPEFGGEDNL